MESNEELLDKNGRFTRSITYEEFKKSLDLGKQNILNEYETSITDFIELLKKNKYLVTNVEIKNITRLTLLQEKDIHMNSLINNSFNLLSNIADEEFQSQLKKLTKYSKKYNINFSDIFWQALIVITFGYVYNIEFTKRVLNIIINFDEMKIRKPGKLSFGTLMNKIKSDSRLKKDVVNNKLIIFLNSKRRNALAHFTFFFKNDEMWLCLEGPFDQKPEKIEYYELFRESITMNIISNAIFLIYLEKMKEIN